MTLHRVAVPRACCPAPSLSPPCVLPLVRLLPPPSLSLVRLLPSLSLSLSCACCLLSLSLSRACCPPSILLSSPLCFPPTLFCFPPPPVLPRTFTFIVGRRALSASSRGNRMGRRPPWPGGRREGGDRGIMEERKGGGGEGARLGRGVVLACRAGYRTMEATWGRGRGGEWRRTCMMIWRQYGGGTGCNCTSAYSPLRFRLYK